MKVGSKKDNSKKIAIEPKPIILPCPVLIVGTYNQDGSPNIMNAAWGGVVCSRPRLR